MNAATLTVTMPTDTKIVMTRAFNAPRQLVWEAMTDPVKLSRWLFSPPGITMTVCEFEARVGGAYKWVWKSEHADPWMTIRGGITEMAPPERLVYTQIMESENLKEVSIFTVVYEFLGTGGDTQMRLTLEFPSRTARDVALKWRMETGMEMGYRQMDAMLVPCA